MLISFVNMINIEINISTFNINFLVYYNCINNPMYRNGDTEIQLLLLLLSLLLYTIIHSIKYL